MKIRNGFVSNSSSSSFILFGKQLDLDSLTKKDLVGKRIVIIGKELYNGKDIIELTPSILKEIEKIRKEGKFWYTENVYEVYHSITDSDYCGWEFSKKELMEKLPEKFTIYEFEKDNWTTGSDLEAFVDNYSHD